MSKPSPSRHSFVASSNYVGTLATPKGATGWPCCVNLSSGFLDEVPVIVIWYRRLPSMSLH
jgi:hypothetical protein